MTQQRTIDPARWCPDCKRTYARVCKTDAFAPTGTPRNGARSARCTLCMQRYKRAWRKADELRKAAAVPFKPGDHCNVCEGLAHRRPLDGCPRCKLAYVPLPPVEPVLRKFDWAV